MADNDPGARSLPSRRRALQIGAGAAFSVPTITSLAATPAYAACVSGGGDLVIDTFGLDQPTDDFALIPTDGTFVYDVRQAAEGAHIAANELIFPAGAPHRPTLYYEGLTMTPSFSLVGCQEVVLTNCSVTNPVFLVLGTGPGFAFISSTLGAGEIIFDLSGVSAAHLANPSPFALGREVPALGVRSTGPLGAR
ncbi:MAG: hypothetical protein GY926_25960 [bacterium]|nr:hypothetical protein [bacterium]